MTESTALTVTEQQSRDLTPVVGQMITAILDNTSRGQSERADYARKLYYAWENGFNLSLAFCGGLFVANQRTGKVEVEAKPLLHRVANDPNYHIETTETTKERCTMQMWRRASDLWPYKKLGHDVPAGEWVLIGETSFTMEDADNYLIHENGKWVPLSSRQTWKNTPQRMLKYRCTTKLISLFGEGIFGSPVYIRGELSDSEEDAIPGEYQVVTEPVPQVTYNEAMAKLRARFEPVYSDKLDEAIQEANDGIFPHTVEQLRVVWAKLENGNDNP